jgi:glucokinase
MSPQGNVLLADIGGTNARLALYRDGWLRRPAHFAVADYANPLDLFRRFLKDATPDRPVTGAVLAGAGPVLDDGRRLMLTNSSWTLAVDEIARGLGVGRVRLVNDFAAIAWSIDRLTAADLSQIGGGTTRPGSVRSVIGPGTGLGVAHLLTIDGRPVVLATEAGHASMPAADADEAEVLDNIRSRLGHVSGERVLSGAGLVNLQRAVAELAGRPPHAGSGEEVTTHAMAGCPDCRRAVDLFLSMLGTFAGNIALTVDSGGGVFIAGGIVPRLRSLLPGSLFRERFEAKGRYRAYMRAIPTFVILKEDVAFEGLAALADL